MSRPGYRIAFGDAARLAEMATFDHRWGPDFAAAVGLAVDAIEKKLFRRLRPEIRPESVKPAVRDVTDQRKIRWRFAFMLLSITGSGKMKRARPTARRECQAGSLTGASRMHTGSVGPQPRPPRRPWLLSAGLGNPIPP